MSEMVERVALVIALETGCGYERFGQRILCSDKDECDCRATARAAIAAMREPTEEMVEGFTMSEAAAAYGLWPEMIDAALGPIDKPSELVSDGANQ